MDGSFSAMVRRGVLFRTWEDQRSAAISDRKKKMRKMKRIGR